MYQFTASPCPPATSGPTPVPLVISPALLADPALSWMERILLARIAALYAIREGGMTTATLAAYLGREPGTVRNLIASLVTRGYLRCEFEPHPTSPGRPWRILVPCFLPSNPTRPNDDFSAGNGKKPAVITEPAGNLETREDFSAPRPESFLPRPKRAAPFPLPLHENQRAAPEITLEWQASTALRTAVRLSESFSRREKESNKSSNNPVPNTESVLGTQSPLDVKATERGTPAAAACKASGEGEGREPRMTSGPPFDLPEVSPGAALLLAAGVTWPTAARLAELRPLPQIEGAIARQKREGKSVGWLVCCLKEGWPVDMPPAPRASQSRPRGDSADVIATRAENADRRQPAVQSAADDAFFEAELNRMRRQRAQEQTEAEAAPPPVLGDRRSPHPASPPAADLATGRAGRDPQRQEVAA